MCVWEDGIPGRGKGRGSETLSQGAQGGFGGRAGGCPREWDETLKPTWRKPALLFLLLLAEEILMLRMQLTIYEARQDGMNSLRKEPWRAGKRVHLRGGFCNVL